MFVERLVEKRLEDLNRFEDSNNKHIEHLEKELEEAQNRSEEIKNEKEKLNIFLNTHQ